MTAEISIAIICAYLIYIIIFMFSLKKYVLEKFKSRDFDRKF